MFLPFFQALRDEKCPTSLKEFLDFLAALQTGLATYDLDTFYHLGRASLVKDERYIDRFDRAFARSFEGVANLSPADVLDALDLPEDWLRKLAEKTLSDAEKADIDAIGGFDELMRALKDRLNTQEKRHQGGNKWIGTAGTSPFGAYGYNPEGVRIGQDQSRHQRAVKVWDKREFREYDSTAELGTRNIKVALKRLRRWARDGAADELDLDATIHHSAASGYIDVKTRPERRNAVKVLLFLDVGGSMDPYVQQIEELFSAAKSEFKHLEHFYFHNCLYEGVWRDNKRRWEDQTPTWDVLRTYGADYKCIFVGDASMSPYEIAYAGGANEHWNAESGHVWLTRAVQQWPNHVWLNPVPQDHWRYTQSIAMIREVFVGRMQPMTLEGLAQSMRLLT